LFQQAVTKAAVREWEPVVDGIVKEAVSKIKRDAQQTGTADVMKWVALMTTDVLGSLAFGEPFRLVERGEVRTVPAIHGSRT
jgi:cytochrome P450